MSGSGNFCLDRKAHWDLWVVECRRHNHSAFNGYKVTLSAYSKVRCPVDNKTWRTKARYVDLLPNDPHYGEFH